MTIGKFGVLCLVLSHQQAFETADPPGTFSVKAYGRGEGGGTGDGGDTEDRRPGRPPESWSHAGSVLLPSELLISRNLDELEGYVARALLPANSSGSIGGQECPPHK